MSLRAQRQRVAELAARVAADDAAARQHWRALDGQLRRRATELGGWLRGAAAVVAGPAALGWLVRVVAAMTGRDRGPGPPTGPASGGTAAPGSPRDPR